MGHHLNTVRTFFEAKIGHDTTKLQSLLTEDVLYVFPDGSEHRGVAAVLSVVDAWMGAFPDLSVGILDSVENADTIAVSLPVSGTHKGVLQSPQGEIPATGRHLELTPIDWLTFRGGKIATCTVCFDQITMLTQLGLMPEPATV